MSPHYAHSRAGLKNTATTSFIVILIAIITITNDEQRTRDAGLRAGSDREAS
jgi:hypothetical protein